MAKGRPPLSLLTPAPSGMAGFTGFQRPRCSFPGDPVVALRPPLPRASSLAAPHTSPSARARPRAEGVRGGLQDGTQDATVDVRMPYSRDALLQVVGTPRRRRTVTSTVHNRPPRRLSAVPPRCRDRLAGHDQAHEAERRSPGLVALMGRCAANIRRPVLVTRPGRRPALRLAPTLTHMAGHAGTTAPALPATRQRGGLRPQSQRRAAQGGPSCLSPPWGYAAPTSNFVYVHGRVWFSARLIPVAGLW